MDSEIQRVTRPRKRAQQTYDSLARWYDFIAGAEGRFIDWGIRMLRVQPDESVLEIGCGTGRALAAFAELHERGMVIGLDLSENMLRIARKRVDLDLPRNKVELCQGDGISLPFAERQFDAVFLCFTLELFDTPELPRVTDECRRVLKPEGRIGVVSLARQDRLTVQLYEWFHRRMPNLLDCRPIFLQPILAEAGFAVRQINTRLLWGLPVDIAVASV